MTAASDAVLAELHAGEAFLIDLARQLVRIPTVNPKLEAEPALNHEADLQYFLRAILDDIGLRTETAEVFPGRPNLVADMPGADARSLMLCGHVDVLPVGDRRAWRVDPFGGVVEDGRLIGRGALQGKAGLAATVAVARAIRRSGVALDGRLELHALVDREGGGFGARGLLRRGRRASAAIMTDPSGEAVMPAACGMEWVRVTLRGRSAPASRRHAELYPVRAAEGAPAAGVNVIEIASRFLAAIRQLEHDWARYKPTHRLLPVGVNTIQPGAMQCGVGLSTAGTPLLLTHPGLTPDTAAIDFDLRVLPGELSADIRADFQAFVDRFAAQDHWLRDTPPRVQWDLYGLHYPPLDTPADHALIQALTASRADRGATATVAGFPAVSDAAHYAEAGIPTVLFGPRGGGANAANEWVELASLAAVAETLACAALAWCGVRDA